MGIGSFSEKPTSLEEMEEETEVIVPSVEEDTKENTSE